MYNIPMGKTAHPGNKLGIFEAEHQMYVQSDMDRFVATYAPHVPQNFTPEVYEIDGTPGTSDNPHDVSHLRVLPFPPCPPPSPSKRPLSPCGGKKKRTKTNPNDKGLRTASLTLDLKRLVARPCSTLKWQCPSSIRKALSYT